MPQRPHRKEAAVCACPPLRLRAAAPPKGALLRLPCSLLLRRQARSRLLEKTSGTTCAFSSAAAVPLRRATRSDATEDVGDGDGRLRLQVNRSSTAARRRSCSAPGQAILAWRASPFLPRQLPHFSSQFLFMPPEPPWRIHKRAVRRKTFGKTRRPSASLVDRSSLICLGSAKRRPASSRFFFLKGGNRAGLDLSNAARIARSRNLSVHCKG